VDGVRQRWHTRGRPATCLTPDSGAACPPTSAARPVCCWLRRSHARGHRASPSDRVARAFVAVARLRRQARQGEGLAPSGGGDPVLPASAPVSSRARPPAA
jgi:hypothetical protein